MNGAIFYSGGRLDLSKFSWWMKLFMRIGSYTKLTAEKKRDMQEGLDRVDKASIAPIVEWAKAKQEELPSVEAA